MLAPEIGKAESGYLSVHGLRPQLWLFVGWRCAEESEGAVKSRNSCECFQLGMMFGSFTRSGAQSQLSQGVMRNREFRKRAIVRSAKR